MTELFGQSIREVFRDHLGMETAPCKSLPRGEGYMADIPFEFEGRPHTAQLWVQKETLKKVAATLLFETDPDEQTLRDMTAELANFIVGHAKMIASDRQIACTMGTPSFDGIGKVPQGDRLLYKVAGRCLALALRERHG